MWAAAGEAGSKGAAWAATVCPTEVAWAEAIEAAREAEWAVAVSPAVVAWTGAVEDV